MSAAYLDQTLEPEIRAQALLEEMSLEEKAAQLTGVFPFDENYKDFDSISARVPHGIGEVSTLEMRRIETLEEKSVISTNLYDAFQTALNLFGVREASAVDLLTFARECKFPYVSPFGLKLKQESTQQEGQSEAMGYNWNFAKALSVALAYCVGGLDVYGLSYSLAREVVGMFVEVAKEQDCAVVFEGEIFTHFLIDAPSKSYLIKDK